MAKKRGTPGGLAAMLKERGADDTIVDLAVQLERLPGAAEALYSQAAKQMDLSQKGSSQQVRLYHLGGQVALKKGGSARQAAEKARRAGRGDDSVMVHVSPEEFEALQGMWGQAETNPATGLPEYGFLSKTFKKIKKYVKKATKRGLKSLYKPFEAFKESMADPVVRTVGPMLLNIFVPGLGAAVGGAMGMSGTAASVVGNAVVQGGLGAATGGKEGAIAGVVGGALSGGLGQVAGETVGLTGKQANMAGSAFVSGAGAELTGGDFVTGAVSGGLGAATQGIQDELTQDIRGGLGLEDTGELFATRRKVAPSTTEGTFGSQVAPQMSPTPDRPLTADEMLAEAAAPASTSKVSGRVARTASPATTPPSAVPQATGPSLTDLAKKYALPALTAAGSLAGASEPEVPDFGQQGNNFGDSLPVYTMNRKFKGLDDPESYFNYGQAGSPQSGQHLFLSPEPFGGPGESTVPGGLEDVAQAGTGEQPIRLQSGTAGHAQRNALEVQGWTFDAASNMMYPPQQGGPGGFQRGGEVDYWEQNADVPNANPMVSAQGRYVKGGGTGRSDDIEARLSDGEYVIDAESVALLGDGSGDAGARKLDEMRNNLRKHKGKNLSKGEFSHKAKDPAKYMSKMKKLRRKVKYEHGGGHNVGGTSPLSPTSVAIGGNA